ncbi:hypothetical protein C8F04DRAFT_1065427 [Mycena alexandri]|uniref:Uncharacterized protein n=1 Tax=Mycena alexandri TaxID=1745969 RepID=A0AAD6TG79_9AGAR|nr:hypothetical protein C8F04DRAFT_1065427 [Mycena alexandri]
MPRIIPGNSLRFLRILGASSSPPPTRKKIGTYWDVNAAGNAVDSGLSCSLESHDTLNLTALKHRKTKCPVASDAYPLLLRNPGLGLAPFLAQLTALGLAPSTAHMPLIVSIVCLALPVLAISCTPSNSDNPCPTPLKVFGTFSILLILLVLPFVACALCRRRRALAPPNVMPLGPQASYSPPFRPSEFPSNGLPFQGDHKTPRLPPPSYNPI